MSKNKKNTMIYDLAIIGGGAAGLTAAIYAARYRLNTILFAEDFGQISKAPLVENWPGTEDITGLDLVMKFRTHANNLGVHAKTIEIASTEKTKIGFKLTSKEGEIFEAKAIILAMGASHRTLNVQDEEKYVGRGVSYCSTCDAPMFKDKTVAVIGGSDCAVMSAIHLSKFAKKVTIIYRKTEMRAQPILLKHVEESKNIDTLVDTSVVGLKGDKMLSAVKLDNGKDLKLDGLFIEIGQVPSTDLAKQLKVDINSSNYIKVDRAQATNVLGVFAAGDITDAHELKQIVMAVSQGALAATSAFKFLHKK